MSILWVFETDLFVVQKGLFAIWNVKNRFSLFNFTIDDMGIQGVTRGYRALQGVTRGYRGLQGVTGVDKELQGVTKDYRNFFLTRTFPDTFFSLFCIKIKVEEISHFWSKRWTNPFGKFLILRFSYTVVFIVFKNFFFI